MKRLRERDAVRTVAERWKKQYFHKGAWYGEEKGVMYHKLMALDPETATGAHVDAIIGNHSWTTHSCSECGDRFSEGMEVGEEPDYESNTVWLCLPCARRVAEEASK